MKIQLHFLCLFSFLIVSSPMTLKAAKTSQNMTQFIASSDYLKSTALTVQNALIYSVLLGFTMINGAEYLIYKHWKELDFKIYQPGDIKESFDSVIGYGREKQLFKDIVEYLKNPKKYEDFGAQPPRGILLTGVPGVGKTFLVRALAGEANCSFIYACGADFERGSARITKIFEQAKNEQKPCIIFFDEIELIALDRENGNSSMVLRLLTELDGFVKDQQYPIIVIGATNHPEKMDAAILRPGRLSHRIHLDIPNSVDRKAILKFYLDKVAHEPNINLASIVQRTEGLTPADLVELIQRSTRIAVNNNQTIITFANIQEALDIQQFGVVSNKHFDDYNKKYTAYHEAGHALVSILTQPNHKVTKITIIPRGNAGGVTEVIEQDEEILKYTSKEDMLNMIATTMGGRAAEEVIFNRISVGPSSDLNKATRIASAMIHDYGMGNSLMVAVQDSAVDNKLNNPEINTILTTQYQRAVQLLQDNIDTLHKLAQALVEKNTIYADDIYELIK